MRHLLHHHKDVHDECEKEWTQMNSNKKRKVLPKANVTKILNQVRMSGPKLGLLAVQRITVCRLQFAVLDYEPMQALFRGYLDRIPKKER